MKSQVTLPFVTGVYLAVNAVPNIALVVDGPDCLFHRADLIQGNHDWHATLLDVTGRHRVTNTFADVNTVVLDRSAILAEAIATLLARPSSAAVLVGALPVSYLTGVPYEALVARFAGGARPVLLLPRGSLSADWRGGYAAALKALAEGLPLTPRDDTRAPGRVARVAVVGPMMHRNEGAGRGDVAELERLVAGLGLECVAVWPSGRPAAHLARAGAADLIVSLPYARAAAAALAARTGARLVDAPLPVGLAGTAAFLAAVARAADCEAAARAFQEAEERRVAPLLEWVVPNAIVGRRVALVAEPELATPLAAALRELGAQVPLVAHLATFAREERPPDGRDPGRVSGRDPAVAREACALGGDDTAAEVQLETDLVALEERCAVHHAAAPFSLALGNAFVLPVFHRVGIPFLEFGFPAHTEHALTLSPTLGYEGLLALVARMVSRMELFAWLSEGR